MIRFTTVLIDPADRMRYDMEQVTTTFAMKGLHVLATAATREDHLAHLADGKNDGPFVYLATQEEALPEIAEAAKGKDLAVLWCGNKEKPVCEDLPIVALQKFNKAKRLWQWEEFKALATEKPKNGMTLGRKLWRTLLFGKTVG